jgi:hypothetical protein
VDGRTVYFTPETCASGSGANEGIPVLAAELYARVDGELPDAHTIAISHPECKEVKCKEAEAHPTDAAFQGASADGSRAFFLDTQQLTDGATEGTGTAGNGSGFCVQSANDCNLYLYDFARPTGESLIDVSAGDTSGLGPRVEGVVATSADGSHVYFVAKGVLTNVSNAQGQAAQAGANNMYVYERDASHPGGHIAFIAPLPDSDSTNWISFRQANVTPDGRSLVFESHGDLTPDAIRTDGAAQIFRYDAQIEELVRVSIGEGGFNDNGNAGTGDASVVLPGVAERAGPFPGGPTMSSDGSYVFFQSPVALTPHALNDVVVGRFEIKGFPPKTEYAQNVYEYHEGHVYLISDGRDASNTATPCGNAAGGRVLTETELFRSGVCLLGTDATGHNVFFTTADRLVPADTDTQVDIYDARICEPASGNPCVAPSPAPSPPCLGEACHGIPAATPSLLAPGTAFFNGEGNLAPASPLPKKVTKKTVKCKKGFVKKHNKCVKSGKRAKKAQRASNNRRAKR